MRWLVLACALASLSGLAARGAPAAEWPCFHGPRGDNLAPDTGLLKSWPAGGPKLLWTAKGCGVGFVTVSVAGGRLYTAGAFDGETRVLCLDLEGQPVWQAPNGKSWQVSPQDVSFGGDKGGARATPTLAGGLAYHLNETGRLAAFDAATGAERWAFSLIERFEVTPPKWGLAESVLIEGDVLYCQPGGKQGYVVALDCRDGKTRWANTELGDLASYSSFILRDVAGTRQLISMNAQAAFGLEAATGKLLWRFPFTNKRTINIMHPVYADGQVFISNGYGGGCRMLKLAAAGGAWQATEAWRGKLDNHHGGVVLVDRFLYGAGDEYRGFVCLDWQTGAERWREPEFKGSVSVADGRLYCLDERGELRLVEPTPTEHRVHGRFQVPSGGKGLYWAHPVICGGRLYLRHADHLYAYDVKAP